MLRRIWPNNFCQFIIKFNKMKKTIKYIEFAFLALFAASCVTGNKNSEVLQELDDAMAKTPRVLDLQVNGQTMTRDSLSNWVPVFAKAGDVLTITATLNTGNGANSSNLQYSRYYYSTSTTYGLETGVDIDYELLEEEENGEGTKQISLSYTVPAIDDDGFDFWEGDHINIAFWTTNNTGGVGYNDFTIEFTQ